MAARLCARRGERPWAPRPDAQRARASELAVGASAPGVEAVAAVGGPHVPKGLFPWGSLMPVTGSVEP